MTANTHAETPQTSTRPDVAALAQALRKLDDEWGSTVPSFADAHSTNDYAAAILDALPEGWALLGEHTAAQVMRMGAQQERERLRPILDAVWSWHRAEKHQRTLDATTDDAAWNDAMVATVDALNTLRDTLVLLADPEDDR